MRRRVALTSGVLRRGGVLTGRVCLQPHPRAEAHRHKVFQHVAKLIRHVAKIEEEEEVLVYRFGSVPLKTYLPHGDLDLTAFSADDKWLQLLKTRLEEQARTCTHSIFLQHTMQLVTRAATRRSVAGVRAATRESVQSAADSHVRRLFVLPSILQKHRVLLRRLAGAAYSLSDSEVLFATLEAWSSSFALLSERPGD